METLDKHFRALTSAAFARYGFAHGELIGRWAEIAGEKLSQVSAPERIKWPRHTNETVNRRGGALVIRAAPGRALDLQYETPRIIERINRFLGYEAITTVKIVQAATWPKILPVHNSAAVKETPFAQDIAAIESAPLKAALERLGSAIATSAQVSPQHK